MNNYLKKTNNNNNININNYNYEKIKESLNQEEK